jgi:IclR family acetate operon transcriptional repressor
MEAICMAQIESREMMRAISRPGGHESAQFCRRQSALAQLPQGELVQIVRAHGLPRKTDKRWSPSRRSRPTCGPFALADFQSTTRACVGLRVAAAVLDEHDRPLASISLSGPTVRILESRLDALGARVIEAARATTAEVGGRYAAQ